MNQLTENQLQRLAAKQTTATDMRVGDEPPITVVRPVPDNPRLDYRTTVVNGTTYKVVHTCVFPCISRIDGQYLEEMGYADDWACTADLKGRYPDFDVFHEQVSVIWLEAL